MAVYLTRQPPSLPCTVLRPQRQGPATACAARLYPVGEQLIGARHLASSRALRAQMYNTTVGRRRNKMRVSCLRAGPISDYNKAAPMTAWSPLRSIQSLSKFFLISGTATVTAWYAHPHLLNLAAHVLNLDFKDNVTAFQTSFFSFLSLVFAIYSGNTMAFLYDRQKEVVKNLYAECMALEELLEEAVNTLGPDARDILAQVRLYIDQEIYKPENQSPPLGEGHALAAIRAKARNYRRAGTDVGELLQASQRLAHAQSNRQATACRLLPPVHWALLYTIGSLFVSTFILFETGGSFSNEGRHILFTVLCGLMSFVLVALRDLADPHEGVYNATALLSERLSYINSMLNKYEKLPSRAPTAATTVGSSVPAGTIEEATAKPAFAGIASLITGGEDAAASSSSGDASQQDAEGESKPGLIGALMGWQGESGSGTDGGSSGSGSLSQQGAAILGGEAASTDAAQTVPSGMGPSFRDSSSNGSGSSSSLESGSAGPASPGPVSASSRRPEIVRSSIVEKPPSFKFKSDVLPKGLKPSAGASRSLLRVKSLEEQVASLSRNPQPSFKFPASRPSANVR